MVYKTGKGSQKYGPLFGQVAKITPSSVVPFLVGSIFIEY